MSSVTEVNIEKLPESSDVLKSFGSTSNLQREVSTTEVEGKGSPGVEWAEDGEKPQIEEKFSDEKSDDSSIRVVVKTGRRKSESSDKQYGQLNTTADDSQTDLEKSVTTDNNQQYFYDKKFARGGSTLSWIEQKLLKHELKQRLMNKRCQAVRNKKIEDMIKQLKLKQELCAKGTSADAFARMFIDNFMSSWLKFEMPFYSENDFHDFIRHHAAQFEQGLSVADKSAKPVDGKSDKAYSNYRIPALRKKEDRTVTMAAHDLTESSLLVDMSGIFSMDDSSVFGLDSSRPTSNFANKRPASRKCKRCLSAHLHFLFKFFHHWNFFEILITC